MKIRLTIGASVLALAAMSTGAFATTNLVTNGTFNNIGNVWVSNYAPYATDDYESPGATTPPGWTVVNGNEMWINGPPTIAANGYGLTQSPGNAAAGGQGFFVDLTGQNNYQPYGGLEQTITTVAGQRYVLSFDLGADSLYNACCGNGPATLTASAGSASQLYSLPGVAPNIWATETLHFTASGASTTIELLGDNAPANWYIGVDDVSVTAVPEPATWAMLLLGFSGIGVMMRGLRRKPAAGARA